MTKAAAYLRLSREDGDKAESDSIANQRTLIHDHIRNMHDLVLVDEFADDGYTGTNFDRPAFRRMIEAVKNKRIDCIIVKDLSRLGRNYIETGKLLERAFPLMGVRFISVLDNYDSAGNDGSGQILISFKNIINDAYCRDLSVKIRSSLDNKRKKGEFIGSFAPYGYKKDEADHNHLVVDRCAAETVKMIFDMKIDGYNPRRITERLNEMGIPTPMAYKRMCGEKFNCGFRGGQSPKWNVTTVIRILKNEIYTGTMVQNKMRKINYKLRESRPVEQSEWIRVEGTHEAIIPRSVFDSVQELMALDTRTSPKMNVLYPFSGIVKCADCGENMIRRNSYIDRNGNMVHSYICSSFVHDRICTSHNVPEKVIEAEVMKAIRAQLSALTEAEAVMQQIGYQPKNSITIRLYDRQIAEADAEERKYLDLKTRLYADMRDVVVSREEYTEMSARFAEKANAARKRKADLESAKAAVLADDQANAGWLESFRAVQGIVKLERNIVVTLIEKIIVHGKSSIEIVFRHSDEMADYIALAEECRMEVTA